MWAAGMAWVARESRGRYMPRVSWLPGILLHPRIFLLRVAGPLAVTYLYI